MSDESVGKVPLSSVEEVESSSSKSTDELDIIGENTHFLFNAGEESEEIEIQGNLLQGLHPQSFSIVEQRDDLRSLLSKDTSETDFTYEGKSGYIAIEDVNFPESSDRSNLGSFTISGKFLPWPKNFTASKPKSYIFLSPDNVDAKTNLSGSILFEIPLDVLLSSELEKSGNIQVKVPTSASTSYSLDITSKDSFYSENYGLEYSTTNPKLNVYLSNSGKLDSELIFSNTDLFSFVSLDGFYSNQLLSSANLSSFVSTSSSPFFELDSNGEISKIYYLNSSVVSEASLSGNYYLKNYLSSSTVLKGLLSSNLSTFVRVNSQVTGEQQLGADLSSLVGVNSEIVGVSNLSSNLSSYNILSVNLSSLLSLNGQPSKLKSTVGTVEAENVLSSDLSTLVDSTSTLLGKGDFSGSISLEVLYGDNYGDGYGSPTDLTYGDSYEDIYSSPSDSVSYGTDYGTDYGIQ
jgi:hypothetical protein